MPFETVNTPESTANFVQNRWEYFRSHADLLLTLAENTLLVDPSVPVYSPVVFDFDLDVEPDFGSFAPPVPPTVPTFVPVDLVVPTAPALTPLAPINIGAAPVAPDISAYTNFQLPGSEPTAPLVPSDLDQAVVLPTVEMPQPDTYTMPTLDELYAITLPEVPVITIPEFTTDRPVFSALAPDNNFHYDDIEYSSELLDAMKAKILQITTGGTGLPVAVENSLWDAQRTREARAAKRLRESTADELASRNLSEPTGVLSRRMFEVEQEVFDKANAASREIFMNRYQQEIEQLRFAITQGAALEGVLIQQQIASNDRRLRAAQIMQEAAISVFNALVSKFNAEIQAYSADAEVFRNRIQGELAKAELYKAQIDGQKAIGELNQTIVQAYSEKVRAVVAMVEVYKARVEGARAQIENNGLLLEAKRTQVQLFGERVNAYTAEWEGYKAQVEGKLGVLRAGELLVGIYGTKVNAYRTLADATFEQAKQAFASEQLKVTQFEALLKQLGGQLQVVGLQNEVLARGYEAETKVYESSGRVLESQANTINEVAKAKILLATSRAELQLKNADGQVSQILKLLEIERIGLNGKAQTLAQLAASVLSGFNFGASLTASASDSYSHSYGASINYSAGGPDISFAIGSI